MNNQMPDKQFSLWLGKVLQPKTNKHNTNGNVYGYCEKCQTYSKNYKSAECIPDPIPLDWPNAKKHQWAIIKEMGEIVFMEALGDIYTVSEYCTKITCDFESWLILHAQPRDYLQAAAELKLNQENNNEQE